MLPRLSARLRARRNLVLAVLAAAIPAATILPFLPPLVVEAATTPTLLGEQTFYALDRHQLWDKADLAVNVASGDLLFHDTVFQMAGFAGHNLDLNLYYNSLSNGAGGGADFGSDWVMTAGGDVKLTIGTSITYQGPSSFQQVFTGTAPNWTTPAGMDATLYGPNGSSQYTLTYHDNGQVLTFNITGQLVKNADRNGNIFSYAYNANGTLSQITDASGRTVSFNYGGNGNVSTVVDNSLSRTYTFTINGSHNLTNYADPANPTQSATLTYDTLGKHELVDIKDPAGNGETKLTYDTNHRVSQLQFVYDSAGDTYNRTYTYNSGTTGSRCDSSLSPAGNTVVTDEDSHNTDFCWDSSGRVIETFDGLGNKATTTWNSDNKPATIKDAKGNQTTYAYADPTYPNEVVTSITQPTGAVTSYTYGGSSKYAALTKVVESDNNTFNYTYDTNGNPATMTNGMSSANKLTYDYLSNGNLFGVLDAYNDPNNNCGGSPSLGTQCYGYDSNGARNQAYNPSPQGNESYVNDAASRVSTHTDAKGQVTSYTYDKDDRVTQILYGGTTTCQTQTASCTTFSYDADGNLLTMVDQTGTSTFTYDKLNRPLTESLSLTGSQTCTTNPNSCSTYTHDGVGNLTSISNGLGTSNIIHYGYDAANHLTSLWLGTSGSTCSSTPSTCTSFTVDADGNRTQTAYPSSALTLSMGYDNSDRLTSISSSNGAGSLTNWSYTYTSGTSDTNLRFTANQSVTPTSNWSNSYDPMDNLSQSEGGAYAYNGAAELCGSTCGGSGQTMTYYTSTALGSWNSYNYGYDGNGSMTGITSGSTTLVTMSYNAQNQLSSECNGTSCPSSGSITSYTYRGVGQADRAQATGYDGTQNWTSDLLGVSTETNTLTTTGCTCYYIHDTTGNLVEEILTTGTTAGTYYPIFDGEGSVMAVTNSTGTVKDTFSYSPLGVPTPGSTNSVYEPWQFQGEYADNSQGGEYQGAAYQYHAGARYYEAGQMNGHWTQTDPANDPFATTGWNGYNYAGGDTANLADTNGIWFNPISLSPVVRNGMSLPRTGPVQRLPATGVVPGDSGSRCQPGRLVAGLLGLLGGLYETGRGVATGVVGVLGEAPSAGLDTPITILGGVEAGVGSAHVVGGAQHLAESGCF